MVKDHEGYHPTNYDTHHGKLIRLAAYRDGWCDGACKASVQSKKGEWYMEGYRAGQAAFRTAMAQQRRVIGLPPADELKAQERQSDQED